MLLEVDLEYPSSIHNKHSDYPLAPENLTVNEKMLSHSQRFMRRVIKEKTGIEPKLTPKLIPNLYNKKNYIVHSKTLLTYVELGLKLTHVHRALQFRQASWLAPYILHNTEKRKQATSEFERNLYKLLNPNQHRGGSI